MKIQYILFFFLSSFLSISVLAQSSSLIARQLLEEGIRLKDSSQDEKAYEVLSKCISLDSTNAEAYFQRALVTSVNLGSKISDYSKAIEIDPLEGKYYFYRANYRRVISSTFQGIKRTCTDICKAKELNYKADYGIYNCECD